MNIIIKLTINLIYDITISVSVYDCVSDNNQRAVYRTGKYI